MKKTKINPLLLIQEYQRRVPGYESISLKDYYSILEYIEEELILELAEEIKKDRKGASENNIKGFGE